MRTNEWSSPMIGFVVFGLIVGGVARLVVPGKQDLSVSRRWLSA